MLRLRGKVMFSRLLNFFFSSCLKPFSCHDCIKNYLPDVAGKQICRGFKSARPDHMRVESSSCCCPRASWNLTNDTWHVLLQSENVFELEGITVAVRDHLRSNLGIICGTVQPANFFPAVSRFTRAFLTLRVSNHLGLKQAVNCSNLPSDIQKLVSCRLTFANIFHKINHSPLQNLRIPSPKKKKSKDHEKRTISSKLWSYV